MYFKKVELIGFKSFPEETEINFEPGITAIIGPNGCGKTNISDAIRWVLGETSAKSLRGQRMEDIIFNGTEIIKPLSMAEVSLTLNNEDKIIPIEYSEVTVTRRCYRSGESEYFINKNLCRLRDIQELFMDTGIGTESYSVMEQGKVDLILSSKPEDRRFVLEEAAGIAKYNARKDSSLRKLELTRQNLLRIDDIIAEVKREIISMKRQVTRAEKFKENYERLKKLETGIGLKRYRAIKRELELFQERVNQIKDESGKLQVEVAQEESKEEVLHLKVIDIEKELAFSREKFLATAERLNNIENRGVTLKERTGHLKRGGEKAEHEIRDIQEKILELRKRIEGDEEEEKEILGNIKEAEATLGEKENSFNSLSAEIQNREKELDEYKNKIFEKAREITSLANEIEKLNINFSDIQRRFARLNKEKEKDEHEEKEILLKMDALKNLLAEWDMAHESHGQSISAILKELEKTVRISKSLVPELIKIETGLGISSRREELRKLQQEMGEIPQMLSDSKGKDKAEEILLELNDLEEEKSRLDAMLVQKKDAMAPLEKERGELKAEVDKKTGDFQNLKLSLEQAREIKEKTRLSFASLQEKKRGIELHLKTLRERLNEYVQNESRLKEEIIQAQSEAESLKAESLGIEQEKESYLKEKTFFKEEMDGLEEERKNAATLFREEEERLRKERAVAGKKLEEFHKLEISMTEKQAELNSLKDRLSNLYQVDLESVSGEEIIDEEQARTEIEELRQKVEAMGPVNLMALEENKELEDRFELLKREREDILKSREELQQVITRINNTCRQMFSETLEKIRTEFHNIFRLLFNGGKADLVLQEGDILESGIEIVARPPGKNLATISQLSGGEKALTAVALLFALFRIRPSPFCILDEIDAPLDDSNIGRFGSLLKEFLRTTQFIIITHNKTTISLAQVIYGITMEKPGISKIVSVKFSDSRAPAPVLSPHST